MTPMYLFGGCELTGWRLAALIKRREQGGITNTVTFEVALVCTGLTPSAVSAQEWRSVSGRFKVRRTAAVPEALLITIIPGVPF
jgi:hypothetical protein